MLIGIDGSRAFIRKRTGIEEYSYQVIKHLACRQAGLRDEIKNQRVVLYVRPDQEVDFALPASWKVKKLWAPRFWTQIRLSLEMLFCPVDVLFVPAHTVPMIHPARTVVVIHGLEYEFCPAAYSPWEKFYMRHSIRNSCRWASMIIAVSENTKKDLVDLYKVPEEKIKVVYEGYDADAKLQIPSAAADKSQINSKFIRRGGQNSKFLLFIGRLEERKNIVGIIKAFEILKEHHKIPHKLILAGKFGYGAEKIQEELRNTNYGQDIILLGYVSEEEKWELLKSAAVFLFPTFYEGFGIPVLEAQSMGVPVVCSNNSSIPEVTGCHPELVSGSNKLDSGSEAGMTICSVLPIDPLNAEEIADAAHRLISDKNLRDAIIKKGYENVKRFSWDKCAKEVAEILTK